MCIISYPVLLVNSTNIFVGPNKNYTHQITVYSNKVHNTKTDNAMILPVPYANTVQLFDLSKYPNFFKDIDNCFSAPRSKGATSINFKLDVVSVGSYLASVANNYRDLLNIDKSVFNLSDDCAKMLKMYPSHYGFIVCKLANENKEYHPFAYSHRIEKKLFIPTKHYHGGSHEKEIEFFDHNIFTWKSEINLQSNNSVVINKFKNLKMPPEFELSNLDIIQKNIFETPCEIIEDFHKYRIRGHLPNKDFYATYKQPTTKNSCIIM